MYRYRDVHTIFCTLSMFMAGHAVASCFAGCIISLEGASLCTTLYNPCIIQEGLFLGECILAKIIIYSLWNLKILWGSPSKAALSTDGRFPLDLSSLSLSLSPPHFLSNTCYPNCLPSVLL